MFLEMNIYEKIILEMEKEIFYLKNLVQTNSKILNIEYSIKFFERKMLCVRRRLLRAYVGNGN